MPGERSYGLAEIPIYIYCCRCKLKKCVLSEAIEFADTKKPYYSSKYRMYIVEVEKICVYFVTAF